MWMPHRAPGLGFSLIELILMIVIIGIAINVSIPKMNRSAHSASASAKVLQMDLAQLYSAIELYTVEHDGKSSTVPIATGDDDLTCLTTAHLT